MLTVHIIFENNDPGMPSERFNLEFSPETTLYQIIGLDKAAMKPDFNLDKFMEEHNVFIGGARASKWHLMNPIPNCTFITIGKKKGG